MAAADFLRNLRRISKVDASSNTCMICLRQYGRTESDQETSEFAICLPCDHVMGNECISKWLLQDEGKKTNTCPYCRYKFFDITRDHGRFTDRLQGHFEAITDTINLIERTSTEHQALISEGRLDQIMAELRPLHDRLSRRIQSAGVRDPNPAPLQLSSNEQVTLTQVSSNPVDSTPTSSVLPSQSSAGTQTSPLDVVSSRADRDPNAYRTAEEPLTRAPESDHFTPTPTTGSGGFTAMPNLRRSPHNHRAYPNLPHEPPRATLSSSSRNPFSLSTNHPDSPFRRRHEEQSARLERTLAGDGRQTPHEPPRGLFSSSTRNPLSLSSDHPDSPIRQMRERTEARLEQARADHLRHSPDRPSPFGFPTLTSTTFGSSIRPLGSGPSISEHPVPSTTDSSRNLVRPQYQRGSVSGWEQALGYPPGFSANSAGRYARQSGASPVVDLLADYPIPRPGS